MIDIRKHYIGHRFKKGLYDHFEKEIVILNHFVKHGNVALDIGANIGIYTKLLSKLVGESGKVHAFEPVPVTYGYLMHNINRDEYKNVVMYNVALSNQFGLSNIVLPDIGLNAIYRARIEHKHEIKGRKYSVMSVTIDELNSRCFDRADFIKCDVEGAELLVFQGAQETISANKPVVICEVGGGCKAFGYTPTVLFQWFKDRGYFAFYYDGDKLISCTNIDKRNSNSNYIFLPLNRYNDLKETNKTLME